MNSEEQIRQALTTAILEATHCEKIYLLDIMVNAAYQIFVEHDEETYWAGFNDGYDQADSQPHVRPIKQRKVKKPKKEKVEF